MDNGSSTGLLSHRLVLLQDMGIAFNLGVWDGLSRRTVADLVALVLSLRLRCHTLVHNP